MKLYGVEYTYREYDHGTQSTYEIFDTLTECKDWLSHNDSAIPLYIFTADFNKDRICKEPGTNNWNYDDNMDTFENQIIVEDYRK